MNALLVNLVLAFLWAFLRGRVDLENLGFGFLLGYLLLATFRTIPGSERYGARVPRALGLLGFFVWELVLSNLTMAAEVLAPRPRRRPGVVAVPLDAETDLEIAVLACLITLTPGTLSLGVSDDRRTLYVHAMFIEDPDALRESIKSGFERRVLELFR